jgi:hypothetical protein
MKDFTSEIDAALIAETPIPQESVLQWIEAASDLSTLAKLYRLTGQGYDRIQPELAPELTCSLIQRFLLQCIRENVVGDDEIPSRWEAAQTLHAWFCHLSDMPEDNSSILKQAAKAIAHLYLESDSGVRNCIEQGFLEHALEMVALRPYFADWSSDVRLRDSWERALEWGEAHPNYTWGLLQELKRIQDE